MGDVMRDGLEIDVTCNTDELDEALEKTTELNELTADLAPKVSIRNCRSCTFNINLARNDRKERNQGRMWYE